MPCKSEWQLRYAALEAVERGDATAVRRLEMTVEQVETLRDLREDPEDDQARVAAETRTTPLAA